MNMAGVERHGYPAFQDIWRNEFDLMYPVRNSDFRAWQIEHQRGGDYIIYTDMLSIMLDTPIYVFLPE